MPLPALLSRRNPRLSKKDFGSLLIIAGSPSMLGASALCSLAAMRSGAGLVTAAVPKDLNPALQKKISNSVMTKLLPESHAGTFSFKAYGQVKKIWDQYDAIAVGPGLGRDPGTQRFVRQVIIHCPKPLVIDADALFALSVHPEILHKAAAARILTPHAGEMARLTGKTVAYIEVNRTKIARDFAKRYNCVLLLKGHRTIIVSPQGKSYVNHSGNVGMATAGSGDVLTGMITAFLGQGMSPFDAAKYGAFFHGKAGDLAAAKYSKAFLMAGDIIEHIGKSFL
jgi:hydroxyethylthiazole kinase-like uncharacterized protein yjeF